MFGLGIFLVAYLAAVLPIANMKKERRRLADFFSSFILAFLIGWKASLLITDGGDIVRNPAMLLFSSGGIWNLTAGFLTASAWLLIKCMRTRPSKILTLAFLRFSLVIPALGIPLIISWPLLFKPASESSVIIRDLQLTTPEGNNWRVGDAEGRPLVLNFWASWCPPCKAEMPMLADIAQDTKFSDVVFFAVNAQYSESEPDAAVRWLADNDISIPLLFDTHGGASSALSINALPATFILNAHGELISSRTGAVERSWIVSGIRKARRSTRSRD